jgi:hypothetical protein
LYRYFKTRRLTGAAEDVEEGKRHNLDLVAMVHGINTEREQTDNGKEVYDRVDGLWGATTSTGVRSNSQRQFMCQHTVFLREIFPQAQKSFKTPPQKSRDFSHLKAVSRPGSLVSG